MVLEKQLDWLLNAHRCCRNNPQRCADTHTHSFWTRKAFTLDTVLLWVNYIVGGLYRCNRMNPCDATMATIAGNGFVSGGKRLYQDCLSALKYSVITEMSVPFNLTGIQMWCARMLVVFLLPCGQSVSCPDNCAGGKNTGVGVDLFTVTLALFAHYS